VNRSSDFILVLSTIDDIEKAQDIARKLVEGRLAAGVSITSPLTSIYRWKGKVWNETECMLVIRTRERNYPEVEKLIQENHSYELPEIIVVPIVNGEEKYLSWLSGNSR
jgi:periplasmic divalent cation tolerance protein